MSSFSAQVGSFIFLLLPECAANPADIEDKDVENLLSSDRGHSSPCPNSLIHNEDFKDSARTFVCSNANKRGEANLTAHDFASWVESKYSIDISEETAQLWLHTLGFSQRHHHYKGVFFDGHKCEDVVMYWKEFLDRLQELDHKY